MRASLIALGLCGILLLAAGIVTVQKVGRQPDGTFIVATGRQIDPGTISFTGRPIDLALHPSGEFFALINNREVFLATRGGIIEGSRADLEGGASFRGCAWTPDGSRLFVSSSKGFVEQYRLTGRKLERAERLTLTSGEGAGNPVPGGMCITADGKRLYVACANTGCVAEVDLQTGRKLRDLQVQNTPFEARLTEDGKMLVVSNWSGREADEEEGEKEAESGAVRVFVDERGIAASGTVSLIDLAKGKRRDVAVGLHPAGIAIEEDRAYVANAASDSVSEIDLKSATVKRTFDINWRGKHIFGSMPNTLAVRGSRLYVCNGGDNALCEINRQTGRVLGFRPAGFFPVGVELSDDGKWAYVVNTKGNGSVSQSTQGKPGNTHHFQGSVSVIDLTAPLPAATAKVARYNGWYAAESRLNPDMAVYRGKIKHILYIIKENRTYDSVYGDLKQGDGDPELCGLGWEITPNHHALALEFGLFDNAYAVGTNSAEGHQWALEGLANDYIERFYAGYTRSYPYDGGDAMAYSQGGFIWDAAAKKDRTVRVYGEFCQSALAKFEPRRPKDWLEAWRDRESGRNEFTVRCGTTVENMRQYLHPNVICWPLLFSDQWRADRFIEDYQKLSKADKVPNLMLLTLPCDHTSGTSPAYPTPRAMVADNDLALGRIVEAVSNSPQWKETCIFVMEDDAQAGVDHVDGHRTVCLVISPYSRKNVVDSTMYTQASILRSIELMLGLDPMTQFDALATPFTDCFTDKPDFRRYRALPNRVPLDEMNPELKSLGPKERYWAEKSMQLDWSDVDRADWYWLNRIVWHNLHGLDTPYPESPKRG